jgi:hypothetical protein
MATARPLAPLRRYWGRASRAASLPPSYTTTGDLTVDAPSDGIDVPRWRGLATCVERLRVGKDFLHARRLVGAAMCSASHDGFSVKC